MDENKSNNKDKYYADVVFEVVDVKSSNVSGIAYKESERLLSISFLNGSRYVYIDIEKEHYEELLKADSIGSYLYRNIKGKYSYVRVN